MRKLFLASMLILFTGLIHAQKPTKAVGRLENGVPVLTITKGLAIAALASNLKRVSGLDVRFTDVAIVGRDNRYKLVFSGGSHRSTFDITVEGELLTGDFGTSCTTSDCIHEDDGCVPEKNVSTGNYSCTPCANAGKCTKTVSTESLID